MKKKLKAIMALCLGVWLCQGVCAQKNKVTVVPDPQERAAMVQLEAMYKAGNPASADSMAKLIRDRFPLGALGREDKADAIYKLGHAAAKEVAYHSWIKKFPPEKYPGDTISYDYVRASIARDYAEEDNVAKALQYANMIRAGFWKGEGWAEICPELIKHGHLEAAAKLYARALANSRLYMNKGDEDHAAGFAAMGYPGYAQSLAGVLLELKRPAEAVTYARIAFGYRKDDRNGSLYARTLMALGKNKEAFEVLDTTIREGQGNPEIQNTFKALYVKVKGSEQGYEDYLAEQNKIVAEKMGREVEGMVINQPAPMFSLSDVNGKTVSLQDLQGKVVLLDFWATWCGPCKRSFPAMQDVVNKYRNDTDVVFLFIHTWEKEDNATQNAAKYITDNKYTFRVLMDLKDPATGKNKVVESFNVNAIPAKFIINGKGNICFNVPPASGSKEALIAELSAMIELARGGNKKG